MPYLTSIDIASVKLNLQQYITCHWDSYRKIQQDATVCQNLLFHIYMKLNVFRAHYQEPKTALAASGFAYVEDCWTCVCWMLSGSALLDFSVWIVLWCTDPRTSNAFWNKMLLPYNITWVKLEYSKAFSGNISGSVVKLRKTFGNYVFKHRTTFHWALTALSANANTFVSPSLHTDFVVS
jgi:hypothetical protein